MSASPWQRGLSYRKQKANALQQQRLQHSPTTSTNLVVTHSPQVLTQLAEAKPKLVAKTGKVPQILQVLMNLIAEYKGSAANALFNYQALDEEDDEDDDEDYDGSVVR